VLSEGMEGSLEDCEEAADKVPVQPGRVSSPLVTKPEEVAALLSAKSMWTRALRMFTGGGGAPEHSGMDDGVCR
jgi:hypothetical protein